MRLLHTQTLEIEEFNTGSIPEYAILSHTWEEEEVTLQELNTPAARHKRGFKKITDFCDEAAAQGYDWGWVDTCCIDKTNLVELSQAINSMFAWYRDSAVCLAYISDFHFKYQCRSWNSHELGRCRWFTRGWTLQELIAPEHLIFYDARWEPFGTKEGIAKLVSSITGIRSSLLRGQKSLQDFSCTQKMSWAAYRQTTRIEDRAYSLLGLFNICFSPVYGEGWRAFGRLQEEILKVSTDQSIFAWTQNGPFNPLYASDTSGTKDASVRQRCSILAPTPDCFYDSSHIICAPTDLDPSRAHPLLAGHLSGCNGTVLNKPLALTNTGMRIALLVNYIAVFKRRCLVEAMLNCCHEDDRKSKISIFLVADRNGLRNHIMGSVNGIVPAWRVEPYYLSTTTWSVSDTSTRQYVRNRISGNAISDSRKESWNVVTFDLHPIHSVWLESFDQVDIAHMRFRLEHTVQREAAKKRIEEAKKHARESLSGSSHSAYSVLTAGILLTLLLK